MAPTKRINGMTRVIALKREQKPRVDMNAETNECHQGEIRLRSPNTNADVASHFLFFLPLRATTTWCFVLKGLVATASLVFSSRGQLRDSGKKNSSARSHDPPIRLKHSDESEPHTHPPPNGRRDLCFPRFWGALFHLVPRSQRTKRVLAPNHCQNEISPSRSLCVIPPSARILSRLYD